MPSRDLANTLGYRTQPSRDPRQRTPIGRSTRTRPAKRRGERGGGTTVALVRLLEEGVDATRHTTTPSVVIHQKDTDACGEAHCRQPPLWIDRHTPWS